MTRADFDRANSLSYHKGTDFYCSEFEAKELLSNGLYGGRE